jgi:non-ribosomal peptide synthase protein (TIGR01720 family)
VPLDAFPLTPNAKIDRQALPAPDEARPNLESSYEPPRTEQEATLVAIWEAVLGKERIGIHDSFFELGGDSILSIQVVARANQAGLRLTPKQLFQAPTVAQLAALAGTAQIVQAEQGVVTGPMPLTPIQCQFFEMNLVKPCHWNQSILICVEERLHPAALRGAVAALQTHHDALRLRFAQTDRGWQQVNADIDQEVPLEVVDLSGLNEEEQTRAIESLAGEAQKSLDIVDGPLLRMVYFDLGQDQPGRLLMVVHHLAVDRVSWRILLDDLVLAYRQIAGGQEVQLPPKTTAFRDWARRLADHAQSPALAAETGYWSQLAAGGLPHLPVDEPGGANSEATARSHHLWLDPEATGALIHDVHQTYGTTVDDILLTGLVMAFERWTGRPELLVAMESHGREDASLASAGNGAAAADVTRTVGWFTAIYPVHLAIKPAAGPGEAIKAVKDRLHRVPHHGMGFGLLRYLCQDEVVRRQMAAIPQPQVSYNYLGQFHQELAEREQFGMAPEAVGQERSPEDARPYLLDITASITDGQLHIMWSYSDQAYRAETIWRLAGDYYEALQVLIEHCRSVDAYNYSVSDFPDVDLSEQELHALMAEIGEDDG